MQPSRLMTVREIERTNSAATPLFTISSHLDPTLDILFREYTRTAFLILSQVHDRSWCWSSSTSLTFLSSFSAPVGSVARASRREAKDAIRVLSRKQGLLVVDVVGIAGPSAVPSASQADSCFVFFFPLFFFAVLVVSD